LLRLTLGTRSTACALALQFRFRHPHDLIGHSIRFLLVRIVGLADRKLCLKRSRVEQSLDGEIAGEVLRA
jgi:hypothetical protein